jgi:hypothetical protein
MAMTYKPKMRTRERILSFGVQGVGKSNAILTVAKKCPDVTFYVIDTDYSESYARALDSEYEGLENVEITRVSPDDWENMIPAIDAINSKMGVDDWLIFDSMSPTWEAVQEWFIERVHGQSIDDYFMDVRMKKENTKGKDSKALGALEGWMDWPVINKVYFRLYKQLMATPGHLYMTAEQVAVNDDEGREIKGLFGPYGVKPRGQKKLGHLPQTVLLFTKNRAGEYAITTIKDRNRAELESQPIEDFMRDYMVKIAGWRPTKLEVDGE